MVLAPDTCYVLAFTDDRERIAALAAQLTKDGPGKFGQKEVLRWLLDQRELADTVLMNSVRSENGQ